MSKQLTPSRLRADLYRTLDHVLESGESVEIVRKGRRLRITAEPQGKLELLKPHKRYLQTEADDLVHMDWSDQWRP